MVIYPHQWCKNQTIPIGLVCCVKDNHITVKLIRLSQNCISPKTMSNPIFNICLYCEKEPGIFFLL
ncbi:hypothetical protein RchiOBHm_Chr7g0236671 [Rosa chinensis]|uniref:Uncharacterized protein n=1 Tax=Rosa chinensis TaxID=74649 RepID=A0A2P6PH05_ROSCH|nr:hypothetical protein RchiOBHm_Chr7g0236671 [Rosa chinensis]